MTEAEIKAFLDSLGPNDLTQFEGHPDGDAYGDAYGLAIVYADSAQMREAVASEAWKGPVQAHNAAMTEQLPEGYRIQITPWPWNEASVERGLAMVNKLSRLGVSTQPALEATQQGWAPTAY
jgi:hypothetical protein